MHISQKILDKGLLSELSYLKLEHEFWKTPNSKGRLPNISSWQDIQNFLDTVPPRYTGISADRKGVMLELLKRYTVTDFVTTPSGMQAMTIVGGGEVTVAFRGTETKDWRELIKDGGSDGEMALGAEIDQMRDALAYFRGVEEKYGGNAAITLTGHSLGGALAQYVAYKSDTRYQTYTFNGFGIRKSEGIINTYKDTSHIHNFHLGVDFVSGLGSQIGGAPGGAFYETVRDVTRYIPGIKLWIKQFANLVIGLPTAARINYEIDKYMGSFLGEVISVIPYDSSD